MNFYLFIILLLSLESQPKQTQLQSACERLRRLASLLHFFDLFANFFGPVLSLVVVPFSSATLFFFSNAADLSFHSVFGLFVRPSFSPAAPLEKKKTDTYEDSDVRLMDKSEEFLEPSSIAATIPSFVTMILILPSQLATTSSVPALWTSEFSGLGRFALGGKLKIWTTQRGIELFSRL